MLELLDTSDDELDEVMEELELLDELGRLDELDTLDEPGVLDELTALDELAPVPPPATLRLISVGKLLLLWVVLAQKP